MSLFTVLALLLILVLLAYLIETLLEGLAARFLGRLLPGYKDWSWLMFVPAVVLGVWACFVYQLDLVYLLAAFLEGSLSQEGASVVLGIPRTSFGLVATGFGVGMGSTYIHDLLSRFFNRQQPLAVLEAEHGPLAVPK